MKFATKVPRLGILLVTSALLFTAGHALRAGAASLPGPSFNDGEGLQVLATTQLDARDYNVQVLSAKDLGRPINVNILLPTDYATNSNERFPVLYLFHGTSGLASDWVKAGNAEHTTLPYDVITVMPEVGFNGDGGFWFTNWVDQTTSHGPSQFEDYLINELIPWIDTNLRTVASRDGRAVAGLSQGGYGSAEMAARHPDMFVSMASFSGAPEIERDPEVYAGAIAVIEAIEVGDDGVPPFSELGNPVTDQINWEGHDPATLMTNLRGMSIDLWTGEGLDGPYDSTPNPAGSAIEGAVYESTQHFYDHLVAERIPAYYDDYVYGTHSFPYWSRDLQAYLPMMMADFANPQRPSAVSYMSIDQDWTQWGYTVSMNRSAKQEFSSLSDGRPSGFTFSGTGEARVTTPAQYAPGSTATVTIEGTVSSTPEVPATAPGSSVVTTETIPVSPDGRLMITIPLGSGGSEVHVTISAARA